MESPKYPFLIIPVIVLFFSQSYKVQSAQTEKKPMELTKEEKAVMVEFQQALKKSDWQGALSYCSDTVRSKAAQYDSAEGFFRNTVPISEITDLPEFRLRGSRPRNTKPARYTSVDIEDPNSVITVEWNLYTVRNGAIWLIDFDTKPLEIWKKHEILKLKVINNKFDLDPNKIKEGFAISLVPLSRDFIIGKPMMFRLEMKNISKETLGYMRTPAMVNNPMIVKDPDGIIVPYIRSVSQVGIGPEFLEPNETVVLADNYDVRSQYHITKPGRYTFKFRGLWNTKPSNVVEAIVLSGQLSPLESVVESLKPILPQGWTLTRRTMSFEKPEDSRGGDVIGIYLVGKQPRKATEDEGITIAILLAPGSIPDEFRKEMELWGKCKLGFVYVRAENAEQSWPNYKEQIINALKIQIGSQNPDAKGGN